MLNKITGYTGIVTRFQMHVLCATYLDMGHIFWTQFHTLSTLPAMQINEQKKNIHHALSVFDTFPAIF